MRKANLLKDIYCELGEGCVWDEKKNCLYFVDIKKKKLYCYKPSEDELIFMDVSDLIGTIVLYEDGSILGMEKDKFMKIDFEQKEEILLAKLELEDGLRFNDGKCDFDGRVWVGTMFIDEDLPKAKKGGSFYCFEVKEENEIKIEERQRLSGYTIPNGLAWSSDQKRLYHIDTKEHAIFVFDITENGMIENRRVLIQVPESEGFPDGMTIDEKGNLWVAMWSGSKVVCYDTKTAKKLDEIALPEKFVTCCTFGGEDMQTLFITTAANGQNVGGNLYSIHLDVKGMTPYRVKNWC